MTVGTLPIFATKYGQQWMGAGVYETYQSPEQPYLVEAFNLFFQTLFGQVVFIDLQFISGDYVRRANGNAFGYSTIANTYRMTAIGIFNDTISGSPTSWVNTDPSFVIGNGDGDRFLISNAAHSQFPMRRCWNSMLMFCSRPPWKM